MNSWVSLLAGGIWVASIAGAVHAADVANVGVKDSEIIVGQCAALTGPAAGLGTALNEGLKAALDEANGKGGVQGRQIRLVAADDGYEPERCVDCTEKMIEESGVFALAGYVGTPTAKVAAPIAQEMKVPLVGLFTGAALLRQPVQRYVINIRASYEDEAETLVEYLTKSGLVKVAVFYQNDSFGIAGVAAVEKALEKRQLKMAAKGSFERNTLAVKGGLAAILPASPDSVIIFAPYRPSAEFIRAAKEASLKAKFANISFVGTENLIKDLAADANGMLISQVVPSPNDPNLAIAKQYRDALLHSSSNAVPTYISFEGYIDGRVLLAAIDKAGKDLSREKLIDAFHSMSQYDLAGMPLSFSETNHQGSQAVYLTVVKDGHAEPLR